MAPWADPFDVETPVAASKHESGRLSDSRARGHRRAEITHADVAHVGILVHQGRMERRPTLAPQLPLLD